MDKQQTLVLIKPDGVQRGLVGTIIARLESKGLKLVALKLTKMSVNMANKHYGVHVGKPFFDGLVEFITSGPIIAIVLQGQDAVATVRNVMGATNPLDASPGTIRGDFALDIGHNLVHGSDSIDTAVQEIALFFSQDDIVGYQRELDMWITES